MAGWTYILRCSDDSYYVGSTSYDDVETRVGEHNDGRLSGYTHKRRPVTLVWAQQFLDLRDAHALERQIKGWRRQKKEGLIAGNLSALPLLSKRGSARRPSKAATRPPQGDVLGLEGDN